MELFLIGGWLVLAIAAGYYAERLNRHMVGWFFVGLLFSPLVAFVLLFALGPAADDEDEDTVTCPFCAEEIKAAAIVCKHCRRDLPGVSPSARTR